MPVEAFQRSGVRSIPVALVPKDSGSIKINNPGPVRAALQAATSLFEAITEHLRLRWSTSLLPTLLLPALLLPTLRLTSLILPALLLTTFRLSMAQLPMLLPWTLPLRTSPLSKRLLPAFLLPTLLLPTFLLKTPILLSPQHQPVQPCFQEVPVAPFLLPAHQLEALTLQTL
ncbi:uncharacterized protein LOC144100441 isoform X1 [Amblyomma americanum]